MKLILATKNQGKVAELKEMLKDIGAEVLSLADLPDIVMPPEDAPDFKGNALIKARYIAEATGMIAVSDDSGLVVDALSGRPGVMSARYNGADATDKDNYTKLIKELYGVTEKDRSAHFACVVAFVDPACDEEVTFEGKVEGHIRETPIGEYGFGYDPVFIPNDSSKTLAEMTSKEKNAISHRAEAIGKLVRWLKERKY